MSDPGLVEQAPAQLAGGSPRYSDDSKLKGSSIDISEGRGPGQPEEQAEEEPESSAVARAPRLARRSIHLMDEVRESVR